MGEGQNTSHLDEANSTLFSVPRTPSKPIRRVSEEQDDFDLPSLPIHPSPSVKSLAKAEKDVSTKQEIDLLQAIRQHLEHSYPIPTDELVPAKLYLQRRPGGILGRDMVLKSDMVPGGQKDLEVLVHGAPNFRGAPSCPVYGVGQPTLSGIRTVLNMLRGHKNRGTSPHRIYWINLREEPVIYLNNQPFVLREFEAPFQNMDDFKGIDAERLTRIEERLKEDILQEAEANDGNVLVHSEMSLREIRPLWESVRPEAVQTSKEVYSSLREEGYDVVYTRLPITCESAFQPDDFDRIIELYVNAVRLDPASVFVFNCQMGLGRSTYGMLSVYILHSQLHKFGRYGYDSDEDSEDGTEEQKVETEDADKLVPYRRGEYNTIRKLVRMLTNGLASKREVDTAIDMCGRAHHLREVILSLLVRSELERESDNQAILVRRTNDYLNRYFWLICFASYLPQYFRAAVEGILREKSEANLALLSINRAFTPLPMERQPSGGAPDKKKPITFQNWVQLRPEINNLAEFLPSDIEEYATLTARTTTDQLPEHLRFVSQRSGDVLGTNTIIKNEFVSKQTRKDTTRGTPFFRTLKGLPMSATGQPTLDGIRSILGEVGGGQDSKKLKIVWINLREEPVVYIKGLPYLLRDIRHPFRVMREFKIGITPARAVAVEGRYKENVLKEAENGKGRVLIHLEKSDHQMIPTWEDVSPQDVLTTEEVFSSLRDEGYCVEYCRAPLHVEETPGLASIDRVLSQLQKIVPNHQNYHVVFNCQTGARRSTMGLVVACLLASNCGVLDMAALRKQRQLLEQQKNEQQTGQPTFSRETSGAHPPPLSGRRVKSIQNLDGAVPDAQVVNINDDARDAGNFKGILTLIRCMKRGRRLKQEVDDIIDECGDVHNLRVSIGKALDQDHDDNLDRGSRPATRPLKYLESYAYLICLNGYLHARSHEKATHEEADHFRFPAFSVWLPGRPELALALEGIRRERERSLKCDIKTDEESFSSVYENRDYNVLTRGSILKSDYFPGCKSKRVKQFVEGSINFRLLQDYPVAGAAIPSGPGICNILAYVFGARGYLEKNQGLSEDIYPPYTADAVIWCNLREEPLLYVNSQPFVLRDYDRPYANLVQTGISCHRLEGMEKQLKYDCTVEAKKYNGRLLLHDEDENGDLFAYWENVDEESIKTPFEMFSELCNKIRPKKGLPEVRAWYQRTPITDEKAPTPEAVDEILEALQSEEHRNFNDRVIIMNCQMGRGRTTTGMIVSCLFTKHLRRALGKGTPFVNNFTDSIKETVEEAGEKIEELKIGMSRATFKQRGRSLGEDEKNTVEQDSDNRERRLNAGWYRVVRSLVRLLPHGNQTKREVDDVIDACDAMQNLRTAIFDLIVNAENALDTKRAFFEHRAKDYLQRYCFLIIINSFIREVTLQTDSKAHTKVSQKFSLWFAEKLELQNVVAMESMELA